MEWPRSSRETTNPPQSVPGKQPRERTASARGFSNRQRQIMFRSMLCRITKTMRLNAAIFLAAFYAFVVLAPHAALALDAAKILHCIDDITASAVLEHEHSSGKPHSHVAPGTQHDHFGKQSDQDGANPPIACCGLFSVTAIASDHRVNFGISPRAIALTPVSPDRLDGEGSGNIAKPPRA